MVGFFGAIILFNILSFLMNKKLTAKEVAHVWVFTVSCHSLFDLYVDYKYSGYWYFEKGIDIYSLLALTLIIPPVNIMYLNWYPYHSSFLKKGFYCLCWTILICMYEVIALLPEPWGYFHYGWWKLGYSAILDPFLFTILVVYFKHLVRETN